MTTPAHSSQHIGYCTNVHAGSNLEQTRTNLEKHALPVKQQTSPDQPMPIGLWLSNQTARELTSDQAALQSFKAFLDESQLLPFTLNGFPFGDFHSDIVKHDVYLPTWAQHKRLAYTVNLIDLLHQLLPEGETGSISTLPLRWGQPAAPDHEPIQHAVNLSRAADYAARIESDTGRLIHLCIEPEPGCLIQRTDDLIDCYQNHLLPTGNEKTIRRHIRVCHDVCHAAVMLEPQAEALAKYSAAGISIGKVQVSSAVAADLTNSPPETRTAALQQLAAFNEPRYLHQTVIRTTDGTEHFFEDLPIALDAASNNSALTAADWRVHFHVPIFVDTFDNLRATQSDIHDCLKHIHAPNTPDPCTHFEVETYAWPVLPDSLQEPDLAKGIAHELNWFKSQLTTPH